MKLSKIVKRVLVVALLAVLAAAGAMYLQASRIPDRYEPARLGVDEKAAAASEFYSRIFDFGNKSQLPDPFTWTLTQEDANRFLASMDEIAAKGGKPGLVYKAFNDLGLSDPAVAFHDGVTTLMIRSDRYNKVISADLAAEMTPEGMLRVRLAGLRIGRIPCPDAMVREWMGKLLRKLSAKLSQAQSRVDGIAPIGGVSAGDVAKVLAVLLAAVNERPIAPELTWPVNKKRVRVRSVQSAEGTLTLEVIPIRRDVPRRHETDLGVEGFLPSGAESAP